MESPLSDDELISRVKQGDRQAYEALVWRYQDVAFRTAWIVTRSSEDAEDAVQAAFIKVWLAIDRFRGGSPFRPWLLRVVANEAKNSVQARQRRQVRTADTDPETTTTTEMSPEQRIVEDEQVGALIGRINLLAEQDRVVIHCRYALELTEAETAAVLGCARGTVKSRLHRALARLRKLMEEQP